jgi:hypothetical protein
VRDATFIVGNVSGNIKFRVYKISQAFPARPSRDGRLEQWYSTFLVRVPLDTISLQLCTPKVVTA